MANLALKPGSVKIQAEGTATSQVLSPKQSEKVDSRESINRSLKAAIEEADRVGYVSANDARQKVGEVLKRIYEKAPPRAGCP